MRKSFLFLTAITAAALLPTMATAQVRHVGGARPAGGGAIVRPGGGGAAVVRPGGGVAVVRPGVGAAVVRPGGAVIHSSGHGFHGGNNVVIGGGLGLGYGLYGGYGGYVSNPLYYPGYNPLGYNYSAGYGNYGNYGSYGGYQVAPNVIFIPSETNPRYYPIQPIIPEGYPDIEQGPKPRIGPASLEVYVPSPNAELWFNGTKMQQTGQKRSFVTPELTPGKVFSYEVRAKWAENGKDFDQTRTINVQAGAQIVFAFSSDMREELPPPVEKK